jgi:hypothetical protein
VGACDRVWMHVYMCACVYIYLWLCVSCLCLRGRVVGGQGGSVTNFFGLFLSLILGSRPADCTQVSGRTTIVFSSSPDSADCTSVLVTCAQRSFLFFDLLRPFGAISSAHVHSPLRQDRPPRSTSLPTHPARSTPGRATKDQDGPRALLLDASNVFEGKDAALP